MAKTTYVIVDPKTKKPIKQTVKQATDLTTAPYVPASTKQAKIGLPTNATVATPPSAPKSTNVSQGLKGLAVATPQEQATHQQGYTADVGSAKPLNPTQEKKAKQTLGLTPPQNTSVLQTVQETAPSGYTYTMPVTPTAESYEEQMARQNSVLSGIQRADYIESPMYSDAYREGIGTQAYDDMINAFTEQAEKSRTAQLGDAEKVRQAALKQAYIQRAQNENVLNDTLARAGIRGGATETSNLKLANQYGQARAAANTDYSNSVNAINQNIDQNIADFTLDTNSRREQYIANLAQALWQAEREDVANKNARNDQIYENDVTRALEMSNAAYDRYYQGLWDAYNAEVAHRDFNYNDYRNNVADKQFERQQSHAEDMDAKNYAQQQKEFAWQKSVDQFNKDEQEKASTIEYWRTAATMSAQGYTTKKSINKAINDYKTKLANEKKKAKPNQKSIICYQQYIYALRERLGQVKK